MISHEGLYKVTAFKLHNVPEFYKDSAIHRHCVIVKVMQLVKNKVRTDSDPFHFSTLALSSIDSPPPSLFR